MTKALLALLMIASVSTTFANDEKKGDLPEDGAQKTEKTEEAAK